MVKSADIKFLTTGGTIDKIYFDQNSEYQVGQSSMHELMRLANVTLTWTVKSLFRKDSMELTDADRVVIREAVVASDWSRIIVTHGTDTMVKTASVLAGIPDKTVVLTGSMQPAALRDSDALFNIGCAVMAVQILSPGVYIAMNGRVFKPDNVQKNLAERRFETL